MPRHADVSGAPRKEPSFPNIVAMREEDERMHKERAMEAGLSPEQAAKHAEHDVADGDADRSHP